MNTPMQAQIMRKALMELATGTKHREVMKRIAIKALEECGLTFNDLGQAHKRNIAAADVGEGFGIAIVRRNAMNEAIERCIQAIKDNWWTEGDPELMRHLIDAINNLKDSSK
jgi:hypothetical protein